MASAHDGCDKGTKEIEDLRVLLITSLWLFHKPDLGVRRQNQTASFFQAITASSVGDIRRLGHVSKR